MAKRTTTARGTNPAGVFVASHRWSYKATPKQVWKALTTDINKWWQPDFFGSPSSKRYVFDTKLGGTMREEGRKGAGLVWGTVQGIEPGKSVLVVGHTVPRFGGPNTATMEFALKPTKGGCDLTLTHAVFGKADASTRASLDEGWNILFDQAMRKHLEA
jgi:uncharacterized protein YndB with AHSA1/START domain